MTSQNCLQATAPKRLWQRRCRDCQPFFFWNGSFWNGPKKPSQKLTYIQIQIPKMTLLGEKADSRFQIWRLLLSMLKFLGSTPYPVIVANKGSNEFHKIAIILVTAVQPICQIMILPGKALIEARNRVGKKRRESASVEFGMCVFSVFFSSL